MLYQKKQNRSKITVSEPIAAVIFTHLTNHVGKLAILFF